MEFFLSLGTSVAKLAIPVSGLCSAVLPAVSVACNASALGWPRGERLC